MKAGCPDVFRQCDICITQTIRSCPCLYCNTTITQIKLKSTVCTDTEFCWSRKKPVYLIFVYNPESKLQDDFQNSQTCIWVPIKHRKHQMFKLRKCTILRNNAILKSIHSSFINSVGSSMLYFSQCFQLVKDFDCMYASSAPEIIWTGAYFLKPVHTFRHWWWLSSSCQFHRH